MAGWKAFAARAISPRRFGPPAHDQRGKYEVTGKIGSTHGLGSGGRIQASAEDRAARAGTEGQRSRALHVERPNQSRRGNYKDRWDVTEALIPIVREELEQLVEIGLQRNHTR